MQNGKWWMTGMLVLAAVDVAAQTVPNIGELDRAQGEGIVYSAKAKALTARAEAEGKSRAVGATTPVLLMVAAVETVRGAVVAARVRLPSGAEAEGSEGDTLAGGYKVVAIDSNRGSVTLKHGRQTINLSLSGQSQSGGAVP